MQRHQLAVIAAAVGTLLFGVMYLRGHPPVLGEFFAALGPVITALSVLYLGFDHYLWRLPGVRQLVAGGRPYVAGTWEADMRSNWVNPETGASVPPIHALMAVRQTFSSLSLRIMTPESASETLAASLTREADGVWSIATVYRNTPKVEVRERSHIHLGAMQLQVQGDPPQSLEGHYWTDRSTRGDIRLTSRRPKIQHSYEGANAETSGPREDDR